jgi:hypothetical protein
MHETPAPRITPAELEAEIASEHYFTAADAARLIWLTSDHSDPEQRDAVDAIGCSLRMRTYASTCQNIDANSNGVVPPALGLLTFCVLILRNGCKVVGINYGPVVPDGFDPVYGREDARRDAIRQVWPLLGFRLRDKLAGQAQAQG